MRRTLILCRMATQLAVSFLAAQTPQTANPADSKPSATHSENAPSQGVEQTLQDGTPVKLRLTKALSSGDAKAGQGISFEVVDDIDVGGVTVLHKGAPAAGAVLQAQTNKRMGRAGKLNFSLNSVLLADGEKATLRAVNDSKGISHEAGMATLMAGMPMVTAPFFLLIKGENAFFPAGTEITAFIDGDIHLNLDKFRAAQKIAGQAAVVKASLVIDSSPAGADIEIDGAIVGNTPAEVAVALGNHRVLVKKKGFADWSMTLDVAEGTVHVSAALKQAPVQ